MARIIKHLKPIAYLFAILVLLQSCVVYKSKSLSIDEVPMYTNGKLKIYTLDGNKYKVRRITVRGENVECRQKTKKIIINKNSIDQIIINSEKLSVNLDSAINYKGNIQIEVKGYIHDFVKITEVDDKIIGVSSSRKSRVSIVIPKDQIIEIKVQNKSMSDVGNVFIGVGVLIGLIIWASTPITFDIKLNLI